MTRVLSEVSSSIRLLGSVVDAVRFSWSSADELTLRSTDGALAASPRPGIVQRLLAVAFPNAVLRAEVVHEAVENKFGRLVRRVLGLLGPRDPGALVRFVEDARQGLLVVLLREPGADLDDELSDDANWLRLRVKADEPSFLDAIRVTTKDREAVAAAYPSDSEKPSVTAARGPGCCSTSSTCGVQASSSSGS
jgi:hypothetical protein